jgi:hypothetical protein
LGCLLGIDKNKKRQKRYHGTKKKKHGYIKSELNWIRGYTCWICCRMIAYLLVGEVLTHQVSEVCVDFSVIAGWGGVKTFCFPTIRVVARNSL